VLIFKQKTNGNITILTEVHVKNNYLLIFNAWRQKKARRDLNAAQRPPRGLRPKRISACHLKYSLKTLSGQSFFYELLKNKSNTIKAGSSGKPVGKSSKSIAYIKNILRDILDVNKSG
jgi:hypothetical protein